MTDYKRLKRLLEKAGFVHVAGWVYKTDAPKIRRLIEKAKEDVEEVRGDDGNE